jgi:dimethylglycine dehydrogenase
VAHQRDLDLLRFSIDHREQVVITDVTDAWTTLIVAGPRTRDLLETLTTADLGNTGFPWLTAREIEVAGVAVRALRVNYVGELGWELHVPMGGVVALYDAIWAAGERFGIADFGLYAMNSLRMEKAYPGWGAELTNEVSPVEAGILRFVNLDHAFVGRAAVLTAMDVGTTTHLVYLQVDVTDFDTAGGEPVFAQGKTVGVTTSGAFGHATGRSLAFAYVDDGFEAPGTTLEVELLGERRAALVLPGAVYDPDNLRPRS